MNQKKPARSKFSKLKLRSTASTSRKSMSPKACPKEKISSYFTSLNDNTETKGLFDSEIHAAQKPTGTNLEKSLNDENDFCEEKNTKPCKVFEIKVQKDSKISKKPTRNKNNLSRFVKIDPSCSDTNQENLQLALAMSKSIEEYENPGQSTSSQDSEYDSPYPSTQQKIATIKSTLDQFGFSSNRTPVEVPTFKNSKQKKIFKHLTPVLFLRTEEDRATLIETKVSTMLINIATYNRYLEQNEPQDNSKNDPFINKPNSFLLRDYYDEDSTLFKINNFSLSEMDDKRFYNQTVPKEIVKTGVLLKDWGRIPGREKTPPIDIIVEETENIQNQEKSKIPSTDQNIFSTSPNNMGEKTENIQNKHECTVLATNRSIVLTSLDNIIVKETEGIQNGKKSIISPTNQSNVKKAEDFQKEEKSLISSIGQSIFSASTINIVVEEKEDMENDRFLISPTDRSIFLNSPNIEEAKNIQQENDRNDNKFRDSMSLNSPINGDMSPELFSDDDIELIYKKLPNKNVSPRPQNFEETSVIIISSDSNPVNTPDLLEKEIFTDDSDAVSLSLLDNISPKRLKHNSPRENLLNSKSPRKKCLFTENKSTLTAIKSTKINTNNLFDCSPIKSAEMIQMSVNTGSVFSSTNILVKSPIKSSQICHYENFQEDDCFPLSLSSENSDIFNDTTLPNSPKKDEKNTNLCTTETLDKKGELENYLAVKNSRDVQVEEAEIFVDLTQSSDEVKDSIPNQNSINCVQNNEKCVSVEYNNLEKENDDLEKTILLKYDAVEIRNKNFEDNNSSPNVIEGTEDAVLPYKNIILEENAVPSSSKNVILEENNSSDPVKTVIPQKTDSNIIDGPESSDAVPYPKNNLNKTVKNSSPKYKNYDTDISLRYSPKTLIEVSETEADPFEENNPEFDVLNSSKIEFYGLPKSTLTLINYKTDSENQINRISKNNTPILISKIGTTESLSSTDLNKSFETTPKRSETSFRKRSKSFQATPKISEKSFRKSLSENVFAEKDFFKLASPFDATNYFTQPCLKNDNFEFEKSRDTKCDNLTYKKKTNRFRRSKSINFDSSDEEFNPLITKNQKKSKLKKNINDISKSSNDISSEEKKTNKNKFELQNSENLKKCEEKVDFLHSSQSSIDSNPEISDEELLYVSNRSFKLTNLDDEEENFSQSSEDSNPDTKVQENVGEFGNYMDFNDLPNPGYESFFNQTRNLENLKHSRVQELGTPKSNSLKSGVLNAVDEKNDEAGTSSRTNQNVEKTAKNAKNINITPNNEFIVKETDVTPMPNFHGMDTPKLKKELDKYGIRPLKRAKGIKILQYIYEATHPVLELREEKSFKSSSDDEDNNIIKRRKKTHDAESTENQLAENSDHGNVDCIGSAIAESENIEDMIFERKQSTKIASCRLPLHIAWYNLVSSWQELHEKILLYEPIPLEQIYGKFKSFGYKFHIKDIISFLDKKCINITTKQNKRR